MSPDLAIELSLGPWAPQTASIFSVVAGSAERRAAFPSSHFSPLAVVPAIPEKT